MSSPTLSSDHYDRVLDMITDGDDPLGIGPTDDYGVVRTALHAALGGVDETQVLALTSSIDVMMRLQDRDDVGIDLVTARIVAHLGIDPLFTAWLAMADDLVRLVDGGEDRLTISHETIDDHDETVTTLHLGGGRWWESTGVVTIDELLPESVLAAAVGRPLATILSHPALDAHDLTIADARPGDDGASVVLTIDERRVPLTPDGLAAVRPVGGRHAHAV